MTIIPVGFAHVVLKFSGTGLPEGAAVTFGVRLDTVDFLSNIADDIAALWGTTFKGAQCTTATLTQVDIKSGPNDTGALVQEPVSVVGTSTDAQAPPNVALLVKKASSLGGREGRGRFFVPAIAETIVGPNGAVGSAQMTAYQGYANNFLTGLQTLDVPMVILHNSLTSPSDVISLLIDPKVATQRRRLR